MDAYEAKQAQKRGGGEIPAVLEELAEILPDKATFSETSDLAEGLNAFLADLKPEASYLFMRRYWFGDSLQELAERSGYGLSKIKMSLSRSKKTARGKARKGGLP